MTEADSIQKYEPLFGDWHVEETVGHGSFGTVYKVKREVLAGHPQISAVKMITVPTEEQLKDAETSMGSDRRTLSLYFEDIIQHIVREIEVLDTLSDNTNIIGYKDHKIIRHEDGIGWDILIRMEFVTPLRKHMREHPFARQEGVCLGLDILTALELCQGRGIIHRDIKDDNIFVNAQGVFKLGDFGIARQMAEGGGTATRRMGTPWFMAPEVYFGERYDHRADIYSLGMVLYRYFNGGRMPFVPPEKPDAAFERRMRGEALPMPRNADGALRRVILKACAFRAEDRYQSAAEMKRDLAAALNGEASAEECAQAVDSSMAAHSGAGGMPKEERGQPLPPPQEEEIPDTVSLFGLGPIQPEAAARREVPADQPEEEIQHTVSLFEQRKAQPPDTAVPGAAPANEAPRAREGGDGIPENATQKEESYAGETPGALDELDDSYSRNRKNVHRLAGIISIFISFIGLLMMLSENSPGVGLFILIIFLVLGLIVLDIGKDT